MKGEKLLLLMGEIDEKFIEEIENEKKLKLNYKNLIIAASLLLAVLLGTFINKTFSKEVAKEMNSSIQQEKEFLEIEPDENLHKLSISGVFGDGMGYAGISIKDLEDLENKNPWKDYWNLSALPVYKNKYGFTRGFIVGNYTIDEMKKDIKEVARYYNIDLKDEDLNIEYYNDYEFENKTYGIFKGDRNQVASRITGGKFGVDDYFFEVGRGGNISVTFNDNSAIYTKDELGIQNGYQMTKNQVEILSEYLLEKYPHLLPFKNPISDIYNLGYDNEGGIGYRLRYYEDDKNILSKFLNYQLGPSIDINVNHIGNIFRIQYNLSGANELVGNYPIISPTKAKEKMKRGEFITTVPYDFLGTEYIKKIDLVYMDSLYQEYLIPYYKIYVLIPEEVESRDNQDLMHLGIYYVPAVEEEYLENIPIYDGKFN